MHHRKLLKTAVPHIFSWNPDTTPSSAARQERFQKRNVKIVDDSTSDWHIIGAEETINTSIHNGKT